MPPALRLTRDLVDRLPPRVDEQGPIVWTVADSYYPDTAARLLADVREEEDFWVFAIGSLIWNPRMPFVERRPALVRGWRRAFCLGPDTRYRGSPNAPGIMLSLTRGGQARGVTFRMAPEDRLASLTALLHKEPPTPPSWVRARTAKGDVRAIAFTLPDDHFRRVDGLSEGAIADLLASSVGDMGTMADYLLKTVTLLEETGIHDRYLWRLQAMVAERLERLPQRR